MDWAHKDSPHKLTTLLTLATLLLSALVYQSPAKGTFGRQLGYTGLTLALKEARLLAQAYIMLLYIAYRHAECMHMQGPRSGWPMPYKLITH